MVDRGEAQGTTYTIKYFSSDSLKVQIDSVLQDIDYSLSTYKANSLISQFNRADSGLFWFTDTFGHFLKVLELSKDLYEATDYAFDPSVKPLVDGWGFGLKKAEKMDSARVDSLKELLRFGQMTAEIDQGRKKVAFYKPLSGFELDFNAIAQGYTVDVLGAMLDSRGVKQFLVELGGEMLAKGGKKDGLLPWTSELPWKLGIDRPVSGERAIQTTVEVVDGALATSGNYRKFYVKDGRKYAHTIDPKTGFPVEHNLLSATVISNYCSSADALATAFMVMGYEKSMQWIQSNDPNLKYVFILSEGDSLNTVSSPSLEGQ